VKIVWHPLAQADLIALITVEALVQCYFDE